MSLTDACALFDDYLKQLGVNIDGRECDNHVLGEGWVRVNGYTLPDTSSKLAAGAKPKRTPLNACLWQLPGDNTWTVGYVDDGQSECRLSKQYCKTGAPRVIEKLSFGCTGDEANELPNETELAASLQGTWLGQSTIQRVLFEPGQRITVVTANTTVKGTWFLSGSNSIDVKAEDGTLQRYNYIKVDGRLHFGAGPVTWSRSADSFIAKLDDKRAVRRLDGKCWLMFKPPADKAIEINCPLRTLKTGALVNFSLPSGENFALKRLVRKDGTGAWLGAVMLDGKLQRNEPEKKK